MRAMPLIRSALKGKLTFATTVRVVRILYTVLRRHINTLPTECGDALETLTNLLDHDSAIWKRALCMEVFRGIFAEHALLRRIFALYDAKEGERDILKTLTATFVRLSTEKPAVIGLGHQSTMPMTTQTDSGAPEQVMLEASGVAGIIGGPGGTETSNTGISTQWSSVRVPCIDQLDKTEPPYIPESYTYSLVLTCISSLSDGLAKFVLPLTVSTDGRSKRKASKPEGDRDSPAPPSLEPEAVAARERSERTASFKKNPIPINPLDLEDHPMLSEVKICAAIIDECWPAILATCSTFLYAALDSEYYHGLVRAFQRLAHVAGLLQLQTPRDAFLTTLGKAAVPPNVLSASLNASQPRPTTPNSAVETPSSLFNNARGLLSVENLGVTTTEKQRQGSLDPSAATLTTRNLLCLRALLNLGIALGPTLGPAWRIVLETLQQADFILFSSGKTPGRTPSLGRGQDQSGENDANSLTANFSNEVRAVETAASRLMESTVDFPNEAYVEVVEAICKLLEPAGGEATDIGLQSPASPSQKQTLTPTTHRRTMSFSNQATSSTVSTQEDQFALAKLGDLASINMERLLAYPPDISGWEPLISRLTKTLGSSTVGHSVRIRASEILARLMLEAANLAISISPEARGPVQLRILNALHTSLEHLQGNDDRGTSVSQTSTNVEIHKIILDGLKGIIEECGQSLISGWEVAFDIIGSVFSPSDAKTGDRIATSAITTRSPRLIRSSFSSLQLICSDFLMSLPNSCFLILVDTLYKFSSQDEDLNIALTTVTFFWVLSDFLSSKNELLEITADLMRDVDVTALEKMAADRSQKGSDASLWMLLLLRLTAVASDGRLELRNSAIQTLLRIFDAYGDKLSPEAWSICIKSVIFKLMDYLEEELKLAHDDDSEESERGEWNGTAVVVLNGISSLLSNYLDALVQHDSFDELWQELMQHFTNLLDFNVLDINTAGFKAVEHILSQTNGESQPTLKRETIDVAWELWSRGIPVPTNDKATGDNQASLVSYVSALRELYRLIKDEIDAGRVQKILGLLRQTIQRETVGSYATDIEAATQLQTQVLEAVRMIRTDVTGCPSAIIAEVSGFVALAFEKDPRQIKPGQKRTYLAMSKTSMEMMQELIVNHASDKDIYDSGAFATALAALCKPITLKYQFPIVTKSTQPWKLATSTSLSVLESTLPHLAKLDVDQHITQRIWSAIATTADGILSADCESAPPGTQFATDEAFDITAFHKLRDLITPSLGAEVIQDRTRKAYAESLFKTSIVHAPTPADESILSGGVSSGLSALYTPRVGCTSTVSPAIRTKIAYAAMDELFSLVSADKEGLTKQGAALHVRIACIAAPFLILRCALTLRAYIADQPLRGKMPQPLSERRELVWILKGLVALRSESEAIPALSGVESDHRKHLLRLYPLIVTALSVQGDAAVLGLLREALEIVGGELGF
jgi:hypothetical protein